MQEVVASYVGRNSSRGHGHTLLVLMHAVVTPNPGPLSLSADNLTQGWPSTRQFVRREQCYLAALPLPPILLYTKKLEQDAKKNVPTQ